MIRAFRDRITATKERGPVQLVTASDPLDDPSLARSRPMTNHSLSLPPTSGTNSEPDLSWREHLESLGCFVSDFMYPQFRKPGQFIVIDATVGYTLPESLSQYPLAIVRDWLFRIEKPVEVMMIEKERRGSLIHLLGNDLHKRSGDPFRCDLTREWVRFYLRPTKTCGTDIDALKDQVPLAWRVIPRIIEQSRRKVVC